MKNAIVRIIRANIQAIAGCAIACCAIFLIGISSAQAATFDVSNTADIGPGSLRSAITLANTTAGADTITFSVASGTITLASPLPAITETVSIVNAGTPDIELNGSGAGATGIGIWIRAANCVVSGLVINRFQEAGIRIDTGGGNTIINNFIGTNVAGSAALPNISRGILIVGTAGNLIGDGTVAGRNLISGNLGRGIEITGNGSAIVRGNLIGTDATGTADLGNSEHGVWIVSSVASTIGGTAGTTPLGACTGDCNLISGNNGSGVQIVAYINFPASNNSILGNFIGTNASGTGNLGNDGSGITIQASSNYVGNGTSAGRNVISGNNANGVTISTTLATLNVVAGNYIGVTSAGTGTIANSLNGVQISSQASNNLIGGSTAVYSPDAAPANCNNSCNIISNNGSATAISARAGIYVDATGGTGNSFLRNRIGFNPASQPPNDVGIDLQVPGVTVNDTGDPDAGANNQQNFPVLTTVYTNGAVVGTLNSTPSRSFTVDFYLNNVPDGTRRMGRIYLGSITTLTNGAGNGAFTFTSPQAPVSGQPVTATATDNVTGDTSEFAMPVAATTAPPTAASVSATGRIFAAARQPLNRAVVRFTASDGTAFTAITNTRGSFRIKGLRAGETYVVSVTHRMYRFATRVVTIDGDLSDYDFIAESGRSSK